MYKIRNLGGKSDNGTVNLNFLSATYYEPKPSKEYPFERYNIKYVFLQYIPYDTRRTIIKWIKSY